MTCRNCGTEIADKALICYRCGSPTSGPPLPGPRVAPQKPWRSLAAALGLIVLLFAALFLGLTGELQVPPAVSYGVAVLAALVLVIRIWRRRRRR